MSIEYLGKSFDVTQSMLDGAIAYVNAFMPHAKPEARAAEIEKLLGKGKSLAQKDEKAAKDIERQERATLIQNDDAFLSFALAAAEGFTKGINAAKEKASVIGGIPTPRRNGDGYSVSIPLSAFDLSKIIPMTGELDTVKVLLNDAAPDDSTNPADYHVFLQADFPDLDAHFAEFRSNRQKALDVATTYVRDITDYKLGLKEDGTLILDAAGAHSGEKREPGTARAKSLRIWATSATTGHRFEGTNKEVFESLKADGAQFAPSAVPASIQNGQVSKKIVSGWGQLA